MRRHRLPAYWSSCLFAILTCIFVLAQFPRAPLINQTNSQQVLLQQLHGVSPDLRQLPRGTGPAQRVAKRAKTAGLPSSGSGASGLNFAQAVTYGSGGLNADAVAVADVNGDGKLDLVVANYSSGVSVLLGNGDGTFQTAVNYDSGGIALSVTVADVNGDGKPDLVANVEKNGASVVDVLLGNGDGTFQTAVSYATGGLEATSAAVADVNGDGKPDLVVANACPTGQGGTSCDGANGVVGVLLGNGDGTFQTPLSYNSGGLGASSVAVADVNGDGKPDLLVGNLNCTTTGCSSGGVGVLLGNGDGTFQTAVSYATGGEKPSSVAVADVNGDGKPDLVVINLYDSTGNPTNSPVGVLLGNGDGTFQTAASYGSGGYYAGSVAVADVNGDEKPDLVVPNACDTTSCPSSNGPVGVLLGNGDGTFQTAVTYGSGGPSPGSVAIADVNGDGKPDLLVTNACTTPCSDSIGVLINTSTTATATALASSPNPSNVGQAITFTATVTALPGFSKGIPTGTATFYDGTTNIGTSNLNSNGTATLTTSALAAGTQAITASYSGDSNFAVNTSPVVNQVVQGPVAAVSPGSLSFGNQTIGLASAAQVVTLTNNGNIPLTATIGIVGTNSGDFSQTNNCGSSVAASDSCAINVFFTPLTLGTRTAAVTITDNAAGSPQMVSLTGVGVASLVTLSPASVTFPAQYVGTTGLPQSVTLTNSGTSAVNITSVTTSPTADFAPLSSCGSSVAPAASCSIGVFFDPTASGVTNGALTVVNSASASPLTVSLSGTGQDFSMAASGSSSATVSPGQTANYAFTIAPGGGFNQSVSFACSGAPALSTCSISPNSVNLNGTHSTTVNVVVTTAGNSAAVVHPTDLYPSGSKIALWLALSPAFALVGIWGNSLRRRKRVFYGLALVCLLFAGIGISACGSGSSKTGGGGGGTPAGTYTINVTGSFSSNATSLNHTIKLTLVVQ